MSWRSVMKVAGCISQRHGSADPDPDPHENVMDPQHWKAIERSIGCQFLTETKCQYYQYRYLAWFVVHVLLKAVIMGECRGGCVTTYRYVWKWSYFTVCKQEKQQYELRVNICQPPLQIQDYDSPSMILIRDEKRIFMLIRTAYEAETNHLSLQLTWQRSLQAFEKVFVCPSYILLFKRRIHTDQIFKQMVPSDQILIYNIRHPRILMLNTTVMCCSCDQGGGIHGGALRAKPGTIFGWCSVVYFLKY